MINPHSWGPYFLNSLSTVRLGIVSQDILSTTSIDAGYIFDINERTGSWKATLSYQGQYPIFDLSASQSNRSVDEGDIETLIINGTSSTLLNRDLKFTWDEQNVEGGLRIPLLTTSSKYYGNISIGNAVGLTHIVNFKNSLNSGRIIPAVIQNDTIQGAYTFFNYQSDGNLVYNHFSMSGNRLLKQSRRDINSKWGQTFDIGVYNTPFGGDFSGTQFSYYSNLYFLVFLNIIHSGGTGLMPVIRSIRYQET